MNVTKNNTLFVTVAAWPDWEEKTKVIRASAKKCGVPLQLIDKGEPWIDYYHNKIVRLRRWLRENRPPAARYMVFVDARDVVFVKNVSKIVRLLNKLNPDKVTYNCDEPMTTWPVVAKWFAHRISLKYGTGGMANSGVYFGRIENVLKLLDQCIEINEFFRDENAERPNTVEQLAKDAVYGRGKFTMTRYPRGETCFASDQFCVQVLQAMWNDLVAVDENRIALAPFSGGWPSIKDWQSNGLMPLGTAGILHSPWMFPRDRTNEPDVKDAWTDWAIKEKIIDETSVEL